MTSQITVVGAGAIGGTVGAYLARAGHKVTFIDRDKAHVEAIRATGLSIQTPVEKFSVRAEAFLPTELTRADGIVLLAVKTQHTREAVELIAPLLPEDGMVVSLQNGLCERVIAEVVGPRRTMGAFVNFSADLLRPGLVKYFGPGDFLVGEIDGKITPRALELADRLSAWGHVGVTDNIWGYLWSKLAFGSMLYATALVDADLADIVDRYRPLMTELATEICEVALKERIELVGFHGFEPDIYVPRSQRNPARIKKATDELVNYMRCHLKPRSGIWRDLAVRRVKTDVDHSIGLVSRIGDEHGIKLPLISELVSLVHEVEQGTRSMSFANVEALDALRKERLV